MDSQAYPLHGSCPSPARLSVAVGRVTAMRTLKPTLANLALVALLFGAAGCVAPSTENPKDSEPTKVTVPLKKSDPDASYVVKDSATVSNESYDLGTLGSVNISAKLLKERCQGQGHDPAAGCAGGYDWHYFSAKLHLKGGASLTCEEWDEQEWSEASTWEDPVFEEPIDLRCDESVKLAEVESVELLKQLPLEFN